MQNQHPLFRNLKSDVKFITIGEIMLRLSPPELPEDPHGQRVRGHLRRQ